MGGFLQGLRAPAEPRKDSYRRNSGAVNVGKSGLVPTRFFGPRSASVLSPPLARASVFLSNSSVGTITTDEGNFNLSGIRPGQYNLVVTILGYEDYNKSILVGNRLLSRNWVKSSPPLFSHSCLAVSLSVYFQLFV